MGITELFIPRVIRTRHTGIRFNRSTIFLRNKLISVLLLIRA